MHFPAARFDGVFGLDVRIEFANDIVATSNIIIDNRAIEGEIEKKKIQRTRWNFRSSYHRRYRL